MEEGVDGGAVVWQTLAEAVILASKAAARSRLRPLNSRALVAALTATYFFPRLRRGPCRRSWRVISSLREIASCG